MIKLRTRWWESIFKGNWKIVPHSDLDNLKHDAAVAHALIAELDELAAADINYVGLVLTLKRRTAKRLRSDFGIDAANGFGEQQ